jgi:hypothetical protein
MNIELWKLAIGVKLRSWVVTIIQDFLLIELKVIQYPGSLGGNLFLFVDMGLVLGLYLFFC